MSLKPHLSWSVMIAMILAILMSTAWPATGTSNYDSLGDNHKSRGQAVLFGIRFENWRDWCSRTPGWAAVVMETQTGFLGHHAVLVQLRVAEEHRPLAIGCVYRGEDFSNSANTVNSASGICGPTASIDQSWKTNNLINNWASSYDEQHCIQMIWENNWVVYI